jgi:arylformamidase
MADARLELEYNNRARVPDHAQIFARWSQDAEAFRNAALADGTQASRGLRYGRSPRQIVDVFLPADADPDYLALFIHGGYWQLFEPALFSHMAQGANGRGLGVALVGYDLCPQVDLRSIIGQVRSACFFLWNKFGRRLISSGHSAGGHLTACLVATDWKTLDASLPSDLLAGGMAISGVFDLTPLLDTTINGKLGLGQGTAMQLSPLNWPVPPGRSIDVVVGGDESSEFVRQSRDFATVWSSRGARTLYYEVPGAHHFTVIDGLAGPNDPLVERLLRLRNPVL